MLDDNETPSKRQKLDPIHSSTLNPPELDDTLPITEWDPERIRTKFEALRRNLQQTEAAAMQCYKIRAEAEEHLATEKNHLELQVKQDQETIDQLKEDLEKSRMDTEETVGKLQENLEVSRRDTEKAISELQEDLKRSTDAHIAAEYKLSQLKAIIELQITPLMSGSTLVSPVGSQVQMEIQEEIQQKIEEKIEEVDEKIEVEEKLQEEIPQKIQEEIHQKIQEEIPQEIQEISQKNQEICQKNQEVQETMQHMQEKVLEIIQEIEQSLPESEAETTDEDLQLKEDNVTVQITDETLSIDEAEILQSQLSADDIPLKDRMEVHGMTEEALNVLQDQFEERSVDVEVVMHISSSTADDDDSVLGDVKDDALDDTDEALVSSNESDKSSCSTRSDIGDGSVTPVPEDQRIRGLRILAGKKYQVLTSPEFFDIIWEAEYSRVNSKKNLWACRSCATRLATKQSIEDHVWCVHYRGKFHCPHCDYPPEHTLAWRPNINDHIRKQHGHLKSPKP